MHIEPGLVAPAKVLLANGVALSAMGWLVWEAVRTSRKLAGELFRALLASLFFSLFMQSFHAPVGPSELHFVGAMAIYLTLGFVPTALGFGLGLWWQGMLFDPMDLVHLGVNTLSLLVPLAVVHYGPGHRYFGRRPLDWPAILKLDALYYSGVTVMVGFWLALAEVATPWSAWLAFAGSYLVVVMCEPLFTWTLIKALKQVKNQTPLDRVLVIGQLTVRT